MGQDQPPACGEVNNSQAAKSDIAVFTFGDATTDFSVWLKQKHLGKDMYKLRETIPLKHGTLFVFTCAFPLSITPLSRPRSRTDTLSTHSGTLTTRPSGTRRNLGPRTVAVAFAAPLSFGG